jgi:hypothetical protein
MTDLCPPGALCVWQKPDFQGDRDVFTEFSTKPGCLNIHFRSIVNNMGSNAFVATVFSLGGCRGEKLRTMVPGTQDSDLEGQSMRMARTPPPHPPTHGE